VSPIRLFILGALAERGAMHGHQLRLLGEEERIHHWTDVSVGSVYGVLKRLAAEGLIEEVRVERDGAYPARQVYEITDEGRSALTTLREEGLRTLVMKHDPFDLAITRLDPERLDSLPQVIENRLLALRARLGDQRYFQEQAAPYLTVAETWAMEHRADRLRSEIASHERLLSELPRIVDDERNRKAPTP
jgi:DNA-binding PadR family transcriptional regulator